mgnify:CR=1 FL=1
MSGVADLNKCAGAGITIGTSACSTAGSCCY